MEKMVSKMNAIEKAMYIIEMEESGNGLETRIQERIEMIKNNEIKDPSRRKMIDKLKEITNDYEFMAYVYAVILKEENMQKIVDFITERKEIKIEEVKELVEKLSDEEMEEEW